MGVNPGMIRGFPTLHKNDQSTGWGFPAFESSYCKDRAHPISKMEQV
jgi:hypothetical protein